jgi:hypothetical protein
MSNEDMNALIRRPRKGSLQLISENGKGKLVPIAAEDAGDGEQETLGSADGGAGRDEGPRPTPMNKLIRDLAYGAQMRSARQGD